MDSLDVFFDYILPDDRIAQRPVASGSERAEAKMLYACGGGDFGFCEIRDEVFSRLPKILRSGDLLVFNNSLVLPVRLFANLQRSSRTIEVLLVRRVDNDFDDEGNAGEAEECWLALVRPMKKLHSGDELDVGGKLRLVAGLRSPEADGRLLEIRLSSKTGQSIGELISELGSMPIPPYIRQGHSDALDRVDYQTVFAQIPGSIAAPTAGLHFTDKLINELHGVGVETCYVTLHVGAGSFLPIETQDISKHRMLAESYVVSKEVWEKIVNTRKSGGRVIAVGTTVTRTLETIAMRLVGSTLDSSAFCCSDGAESCISGASELFITPGFRFKIVDGLITNFHQPKTTHLLLVSAMIGGNLLRTIYEHALKNDYQFLSYGDGMLFLPGVSSSSVK